MKQFLRSMSRESVKVTINYFICAEYSTSYTFRIIIKKRFVGIKYFIYFLIYIFFNYLRKFLHINIKYIFEWQKLDIETPDKKEVSKKWLTKLCEFKNRCRNIEWSLLKNGQLKKKLYKWLLKILTENFTFK